MSFEDYKKGVIQTYWQLKEEGDSLSSNLSNPSPGKIKSECISVYDKRYSPKDDELLRSFFTSKDKGVDYRQRMEKSDIDEFRPLVYFLRKGTTSTSDKNIKLLSWLINYENRESESEIETVKLCSPEDDKEVLQPEHVATPQPEQQTPSVEPNLEGFKKYPKTKVKFNFRNRVAMSVVLLIACLVTYLILKNRVAINGSEKCMYWSDNEYVQVSCTQKIQDKLIIALDSVKLNDLKRITNPDTITHNSVGKVWYAKSKGRVEFYTSGGSHPVEINKRLLPVTNYIINKYILHL